MKHPRPIVGQEVLLASGTQFYRLLGAEAKPEELTTMVVTAVGNKYFTCCNPEHKGEQWAGRKFNLDNWLEASGGGSASKLYANSQEWIDEQDSFVLAKEIHQAFEYGNHSHVGIEGLRQIKKIIDAAKLEKT